MFNGTFGCRFCLNDGIDMNKLLLVISVLILNACAQLQHGQMQPVKQIGLKDNIYFTTCAGAVEGWPDCYEKASLTCNKNFVVISKEDNGRGTKRDFTFQCKR
jgi:hypothetical protein